MNEHTQAEVQDFSSLADFYKARMEQYGDNLMMTNFGVPMDYHTLSKTADALAYYFQHELKLKKGGRIAFMMPNVLQYPALIIGAHLAGLVVININPLYTARELKHQLNDSEAQVIVLLETAMQALMDCVDETSIKTVIVTKVGDMLPGLKGHVLNFALKHIKRMVPKYDLPNLIYLKDVIGEHLGKTPQPVSLSRKDLAFLQYTGGTTGVAKGVMLSHGNVLANLHQFVGVIHHNFSDLDLTSEHRVALGALPIYHIFALIMFLGVMNFGQSILLVTNAKDIPGLISALRKHPVNTIVVLNTLMIHMMKHKHFGKIDWKQCDLTMTGGMATQQAVADEWQALTGCVVQQGFGLSETSPIVSVTGFDAKDKFVNSIGMPVVNTQVKLINPDTLKESEPGQEGELCVKGPQVMQGYLNRQEATDEVMLDGGWFRTGDIVTQAKDGSLAIVDRLKDMILVSGFNVYPNEVEEVLVQHEHVMECGVIGMSNDKTGELVKAFIVKQDDALTEEAIIQHCDKHLANYKIPREIIFVKEIPKTPVGKVLRRELRDAA